MKPHNIKAMTTPAGRDWLKRTNRHDVLESAYKRVSRHFRCTRRDSIAFIENAEPALIAAVLGV